MTKTSGRNDAAGGADAASAEPNKDKLDGSEGADNVKEETDIEDRKAVTDNLIDALKNDQQVDVVDDHTVRIQPDGDKIDLDDLSDEDNRELYALLVDGRVKLASPGSISIQGFNLTREG